MTEVSKMEPVLDGDFLAKHSQHPDTLETKSKPLKAQAVWYVKIFGFLQNMVVEKSNYSVYDSKEGLLH